MKNALYFEYCFPTHDPANWRTIEGHDAEDAAENAGRIYNEDGDYSLMNESIYVLIREDDDCKPELFVVSAEPDVCYHSSPVDKVICKQCKKDCVPQILLGKGLIDDRHCSQECRTAWYEDYQREMKEYREKKEAEEKLLHENKISQPNKEIK